MSTEPRLTRPDGTIVPQVRTWLRAAVAAPSVFNTQPWLFRVTEQGIEVYADPARRLEVVDPRGRELMISVGAALFNLRVAILADGRTPMVRLFPDAAQPDLVARVRPERAVAVSETVRLLAEAIPRRHTNRRPFESTPVPPEVLADLCVAAATEGGDLVVATPVLRDAVLGLVRARSISAAVTRTTTPSWPTGRSTRPNAAMACRRRRSGRGARWRWCRCATSVW